MRIVSNMFNFINLVSACGVALIGGFTKPTLEHHSNKIQGDYTYTSNGDLYSVNLSITGSNYAPLKYLIDREMIDLTQSPYTYGIFGAYAYVNWPNPLQFGVNYGYVSYRSASNTRYFTANDLLYASYSLFNENVLPSSAAFVISDVYSYTKDLNGVVIKSMLRQYFTFGNMSCVFYDNAALCSNAGDYYTSRGYALDGIDNNNVNTINYRFPSSILSNSDYNEFFTYVLQQPVGDNEWGLMSSFDLEQYYDVSNMDSSWYVLPYYSFATFNLSYNDYDLFNSDPLVYEQRYTFYDFGVDNNNLYGVGYQDGYDEGYYWGYQDGDEQGREIGNQTGYDIGYEQGYGDGAAASNQYTFLNLFGAIADTPVLMIRSLFDFDFFGVNLLSVVLSMFTALILFYLLRKLL